MSAQPDWPLEHNLEHRPEGSVDCDLSRERVAVCPPAMIWWAIDFLPLLCFGARRPALPSAAVTEAEQ